MYGYYLFVGRGDWGMWRDQTLDPTFGSRVRTSVLGDWGPHRRGTPLSQAPEWSSAWDLEGWRHRIDFLADRLGADTLALCMNGYELPYPSQLFPEAVERDHANVRAEFLQAALDYARRRGLRLLALFCTTGHARSYASVHPDATTVAADGARSTENLCHNNPLGRAYAEGVIREMLGRYRGFDGILFHPPENTTPCHCVYCQRLFESEIGRKGGAEKEYSDLFWRSCLSFQRKLEAMAAEIAPGVSFYAVTIPGRFQKDFDLVSSAIPRATTILHWDYWSFGQKIPSLIADLRLLSSAGHKVGFIPSAGFALDGLGPEFGKAVVEQIESVVRAGFRDILYFVGAIWRQSALLQTSWKLRRAEAESPA